MVTPDLSVEVGGYAPPFAPAAFVIDAVRESVLLRGEQAGALTGVPTGASAAEIRSASIGAGLGVDPQLHALPAVAEVQQLVENVQPPISGVDALDIGARRGEHVHMVSAHRQGSHRFLFDIVVEHGRVDAGGAGRPFGKNRYPRGSLRRDILHLLGPPLWR